MRVLVTGGSGFLGGLVVRQLLRQGESVRALLRPGRSCSLAGVDVVEGDLRRTDDIESAVRGVDAVVHCGARVQTHGSWAEFEETNVAATGGVIEAAEAAGIDRVVHVSSLSVYAIDHDGAVICEDSPYESGAADRGFYSRSKLAADRLATEAASRGAPVTVVRPGVLYGPGRRPPVARQSFAVGGLRLILGSPDYLLPLAFGENVADAILLALRRPGARGRTYTLVDSQVPMREYVGLYRSVGGAKWRPLFIPAGLLVPVAAALEFACKCVGKRSPVTPHQIRRTTWSATFDCTRARAELGWTPRVSLAEGLRQSMALPSAGAAAATVPVAEYETH